jgi:hypothetical protein
MLKSVLCGRHLRVWENERGFVAWDDESKSRSYWESVSTQMSMSSALRFF